MIIMLSLRSAPRNSAGILTECCFMLKPAVPGVRFNNKIPETNLRSFLRIHIMILLFNELSDHTRLSTIETDTL